MKSITLLLTILSALIITSCDKGTEDATPTESSTETTMEEATTAVEEAATAVEEAATETGEAVESAMESDSDTSN